MLNMRKYLDIQKQHRNFAASKQNKIKTQLN